MFGKKKYKDEIRQLKEQLQENERTIEAQDTEIRDLGKAFAEATKAPPEGCKKGNWCQACSWNKNIIRKRFACEETIGVCMKGSCESFTQREETVPRE